MRDKEFNKIEFQEQLDKIFSGFPRRIEELRTQVVDNPNFLVEYYPVLPYDLKRLLSLAFVSWWLPEELGYIIREEIRDRRLKRFSLQDQVLIELFLESKSMMLLYLESTSLWHSRDFFGNFIKETCLVLERISFRHRKTRVRFPQRKRGYHDHGSMVPDSKWKPKSDYSLTELQNEIEENRKTQQDTLDFIFGFLS